MTELTPVLKQVSKRLGMLLDNWRGRDQWDLHRKNPFLFVLFRFSLLFTLLLVGGKSKTQHSSQVKAFEQKYDIRLPEEYRRFIIEIGDGGAGPFSGILPLGRYFPLEDDPRLNRLNQPFPHRTSWSEDALREEELELYQSDREYLNQLTQGALIIQDFGCAISVLLVVTGERRGSIWMDDTANAGTITPMENGESFLKWYSRWLDEVLKKAADMCQFTPDSVKVSSAMD